MTDRYLADRLDTRHPGIRNLYAQTSGYVHLSNDHILNAVNATEDDLIFAITIDKQNSYVPDAVYLEAIESFKGVSNILFRYISAWYHIKEHGGIIKLDSQE